MGFYVDSGSYLRDNLNILDFIIVFFSIIDMLYSNSDLKFIKVYKIKIRLLEFWEYFSL